MTMEQPGFFSPPPRSPRFSPRGAKTAASSRDSSPLRETLPRLIDFDRCRGNALRGCLDTQRSLAHREWLKMPSPTGGVTIDGVHRAE